MQKVLLIILVLLVGSCSFPRRLSSTGEIVEIHPKKGNVLIYFPCVNPPYKQQPCFGADYFDLRFFPDAYVGQKVTIESIDF